jgi:hypothetical protein
MAKELKEQGLYKAKGVITRLPRAAVAEVSTFDPEAVVQVRADVEDYGHSFSWTGTACVPLHRALCSGMGSDRACLARRSLRPTSAIGRQAVG